MLLELANHHEQILADEGVKSADEIRRLELDGWADTTGVRFADGGWHARIAEQGGHGIRGRTSGMLTLLRDVSMAPGGGSLALPTRAS